MGSSLQLPGAQTRVLDDKQAVARAAVELILQQADAAVATHGRFRILLAGGTTPSAAYRLLASRDARWEAWEVYHGDERCLPPGDVERNSRAAAEAWLDRVPIPPEAIHVIPAEQGAEPAADAYEPIVAAALPFDLVLLGIGEDGHTASLFPGRAVAQGPLVVPVHDAPKPPPDRVSLTPKALGQSARTLILITGAGKRDAVSRWRAGERLPVAEVAAAGNSLVLIDRDALPD